MDKQIKKDVCGKFRAALRERNEASVPFVKAIQSTTGKDRERAWDNKRAEGVETRYILLAYACFRGVPYEVLEKTVADGNSPYVPHIAHYGSRISGLAFDVDAVTKWLGGERPESVIWEPKKEPVPFKQVEVARPVSTPKPSLWEKVSTILGWLQ